MYHYSKYEELKLKELIYFKSKFYLCGKIKKIMLKLTQINVYPVKSLDGFSPDSAIVEKRGLQHDRRWLITDTDGMFLTQRTNPKMAMLRATIEGDCLVIQEKNKPSNDFKIPINTEGSLSPVTVWDDTVKAASVSKEVDGFLSDFLEKEVRLVKMPDTTERRIEENYNRGNDIVSFADGYPFLIIGEASMADLNEKIIAPLSPESRRDFVPLNIRRFRTNFIFSGGKPFQEDDFKNFKIGDVDFMGMKNCARCVLTTRDPDTGVKGKEPLLTLQEYRQKGTKTLFGQNIIWNFDKWANNAQPEISVGDIITLL
jgi:uncharacterized protein